MKKIAVIIIFISHNLFSQSFNGSVEYVEKLSEKEFEKQALSDPNMDPNMRKFIESRIREKLQKNFILSFEGFQSEYKEIEKVKIRDENSNGSWSPYGIDLELYKNLKTKKIIIKKDLMSKYFYVENKLTEFNWVILNETKKIGGYDCNKAQIIIPVTKEEIKEYEKEVEENEENKTNFLKVEKPTDKIINVWYTIEIPVNNGPKEYWGLPGLILEVNDGKNIILCTKVILNKKRSELKVPKRKDLISQDKFDKIVAKKYKEIENFN